MIAQGKGSAALGKGFLGDLSLKGIKRRGINPRLRRTSIGARGRCGPVSLSRLRQCRRRFFHAFSVKGCGDRVPGVGILRPAFREAQAANPGLLHFSPCGAEDKTRTIPAFAGMTQSPVGHINRRTPNCRGKRAEAQLSPPPFRAPVGGVDDSPGQAKRRPG